MEKLTLQSIRDKKQIVKNENTEELIYFLNEVKKEMLLNKIFYSKAKFSCFSDNVFTYSYSNHSLFFEFNIICEDTLYNKMTIKDLLELKKISYFSNGIYDKKTMEKIGGIYFSELDDEEQEKSNLINLYNELKCELGIEDFEDEIYLGDGVYLNNNGIMSVDETKL